ncbi:MAG: hypothetical protein J5613_04035 [Alphaproteobacteria bacterium]|nr:hypothetical protein [Alphaproteobacteria bacterium]
MKNKLFLLTFLIAILIVGAADAVCPVCTIAIGAGLEGMRMMGVKDVISGIWAGGLTFSLIGWTANYMRAHNVKNKFWYFLNPVFYLALLASVYFIPRGHPIVQWWENCMWGMDQFMLGAIVGAIVFVLMELWYMRIKRNHGGHAMFPFQKVVMPVIGLLVATGVFWLIISYLPKFGIVLC